jgi:hypothetical protein
VYLLEHTGDVENASDFISAAEQSKVRVHALYSEYLQSPTSTVATKRKLELSEYQQGLAEAYVRSYLGGRASGQIREGEGAVSFEQSARVSCLPDGSALVMCVATAKLVLLTRFPAGVIATTTAPTGTEVAIRLGDALPGDIRSALSQCCAGLAVAFPSHDASHGAAALTQDVIAALFAHGER